LKIPLARLEEITRDYETLLAAGPAPGPVLEAVK
jgi:hypothetical protein